MEINKNLQVSPNFQLWEFVQGKAIDSSHYEAFWASLGHPEIEKIYVLAGWLQAVRDHYAKPVIITNSFRPFWYEKSRNRSGKSQHVTGGAADFYVQDIPLKQVYSDWEPRWAGGFAINNTQGFIHADVRSYKARWEY